MFKRFGVFSMYTGLFGLLLSVLLRMLEDGPMLPKFFLVGGMVFLTGACFLLAVNSLLGYDEHEK